ncbi:MAG: proprotein convertase P-domain-containing protein [Deltaproteobacteria bacterium]|nr:proprotein convertase P-domain-containing protein [Deltaproteobacteria bacterium]
MRSTLTSFQFGRAALPLAAVALLAAPAAHGAIPGFSAVEGALTASGGAPAADGIYAVTFAVYKEETGGNPLWSEGPVNIGVKGGQWTHQLGSVKPLAAGVLNGANLWLGLQIGSDPELPRRQLSSAAFAMRAAVADALECSGCVGAGALDPKALEGLAKKSDLAAVALSGNFSDLKGGPDLSAYAKTASLAAVATSGEFKDLKGGPDLSGYAKVASLAPVAQSGSYNDLKDKPAISDAGKSGNYGDLLNKPVLAQVGKNCGTGLVVSGIKADGSLECAASAIAPDMIDEISNGLIWNQFIDSTPGGQNIDILDGNGAGKSDSLNFPDIGTAQSIWVVVDLVNSQISDLTIELYGPGMGNPYVLHSKSGSGQTIKTSYNKETPLASGDMNKDWVGKNPKGTWSITVKDPNDNQLNNPLDGKFSWSLSIQTLSTKKIQIKGNLIVDGDLTIKGVNTAQTNNTLPATYRFASFHTHQHSQTSWVMGNNAAMFGGVHPSTWTDGSAVASSISADKDVQRALFTQKRFAGKNAMVCSDVWLMYSSTDGKVCAALFRVKNSTGADITWTPHFYYTAYSGWSEAASIAVNGANVWSNGGTSNTSVGLTIPKNRVSTVIFVATGSHAHHIGHNIHERVTYLAFYNNSLALPSGLSFVDDLDTATGGYEQ